MTRPPYRRSQSTSYDFAQKGQDVSLHSLLNHLLQGMQSLSTRIQTQVGVVTHSYDPDKVTLNKECSSFLKEFGQFAELAFQLKPALEQKINELKDKGPVSLPEAIPASSFQTIMILHLVSEQSMGKRSEELFEIKRRQKDMLNQLEVGFVTIRERFDEVVERLNLLAYMQSCLVGDGLLPANIMYNTQLPQIVTSPFAQYTEMV